LPAIASSAGDASTVERSSWQRRRNSLTLGAARSAASARLRISSRIEASAAIDLPARRQSSTAALSACSALGTDSRPVGASA